MLIKNEAKTTKQKKKYTKFKLSFPKLFKKNKKKNGELSGLKL